MEKSPDHLNISLEQAGANGGADSLFRIGFMIHRLLGAEVAFSTFIFQLCTLSVVPSFCA
jgi:hypothetical protein